MIGVAAISRNGVMGAKGTLPWHIPQDLEWFKKLTMGGVMVMGRKTCESLPASAMRGRTSIVLTSEHGPEISYVVYMSSKDEVLASEFNTPETFVIGGAQTFDLFWEEIGSFWLTVVNDVHEGDTFFPVDRLLADFYPVSRKPSPDGVFTIYGLIRKDIAKEAGLPLTNFIEYYNSLERDLNRSEE